LILLTPHVSVTKLYRQRVSRDARVWWCGATMGGKSSKQKKEEVDRGNVIDTFKAK
jgi:hypothetical protein